ncbi:MAG: 4Fe-4S binding protein [Verrucomicrobiales bacterium]|nr:4Fe-4S binding protein [Verrucomicrobiales bacterium]
MRSALLQTARLSILITIAWLIREHHLRISIQGDRPITVSEVKVFLPEAHRLSADATPKAGLWVTNQSGDRIGYAARTMPQSRDIIGYSGPTDALIVCDAELKVLGIAIRHSYDTPSHVEDVTLDYQFMESWNGHSWDQVAQMNDLRKAGIYGVSGATRTSEALALSISKRLDLNPSKHKAPPSFTLRWQDLSLLLILIGGLAFAFIKKAKFQSYRWIWSICVFIFLGFILGDLLALSLFIGWAESGIPWRLTPGLALLGISALLVPWSTHQPVYCQFICPHGHAQRWLMKLLPARYVKRPNQDFKWSLKFIAPSLLLIALLTSFLKLPIDLAGLEPFDAYLIRLAGKASIIIAIVGLLISLFIPMAYCHYACPTGWLLNFLRRRQGKNQVNTQDLIALFLLAITLILYYLYTPIHTWIISP